MTQPVWEVRDSSTSEPSGEERRRLEPRRGKARKSVFTESGNKTATIVYFYETKLSLAFRHLWYLEHSGTFGARVPQSDVSVSAA